MSAVPPFRSQFQDFDNQEVYESTVANAGVESADNFVVEFGNDQARVARNIELGDLKELLVHRREAEFPVRWLNVWRPHEMPSKDCVQVIGDHYGFSRRLVALMTAKNSKLMDRKQRIQPDRRLNVSHGSDDLSDLEKGQPNTTTGPGEHGLADSVKDEDYSNHRLELFLKTTMNYTSTDYGDRFFCVGTNWLHNSPRLGLKDESTLVPPKHWSWIIICDDSDDQAYDADPRSQPLPQCEESSLFTIITIHEGPWYESPPVDEPRADWNARELRNMRKHTINVLKQLSRAATNPALSGQSFLDLKTIRTPGQQKGTRAGGNPPREQIASRSSTMLSSEGRVVGDTVQLKLASSLFYYLFEDFKAAGPVLLRSKELVGELQSAVLQSGRRRIKNRPGMEDIISKLHRVSKELRQVKHLFQSYRTIVERILHSRSQAASNIAGPGSFNVSADMPVKLSHSARKRFERLDYHLQLLMLNNIEESLEESRALSETYFNLTAQKDSQATARLTRSATLLAKLSVFFLPISFQTAFFSVEVPNMLNNFNSKHYWVSFGVIAGISFISLFFFSRLLIISSEFLENQMHKAGRATRARFRGTDRERDDD